LFRKFRKNPRIQGLDADVLSLFSLIVWQLIGRRTLFMMADNAEKVYAMQSLIEHPEVFDDAIARNRIMIIRKDDEGK
jgi:hypothetical protein